MVQLQLFIEGKEVELHDNESVTLTQSLQDVMDIQKVFTDFTRTFNVPASKVNNSIFKHFHKPSIVGNSPQAKKDAELQLNYQTFRKGRIKLESVEVKNGSATNYRITFFGSTILMKEILGDSLISDLAAFDIPLTYNADNVKTIMQDGLDRNIEGEDVVDAVIYPLISSNNRLYYDSGEDVLGSYNLHVGSNNHGLVYDQLKPAVRLHAIIQAIKKQFNISFSDDFFNTTNEPYYNLYLWLNKQKGTLIQDGEDSQYITSGTKWTVSPNSDDDLRAGFDFGNGYGYRNVDNTTGKRFYTLSIDAPSGVEYSVRVDGGDEGILYEGEHTGSAECITLQDEVKLPKTHTVGSLVYNQLYQVEIKSATNSTFTVNVAVYEGGDRALASRTITTSIAANYSTSVRTEMPKIKVLDLITSLFKMFNLTAYYVGDEIQVLPLDDWYKASSAVYDITKYLDRTKGEISIAYPFSSVSFEYEGRDSFLSAKHAEYFGKDWGSLKYNNTAEYAAEEYNIQLPFEHHKFERLYDTGTGQYTDAQWGWSVDDKQEAYLGKPLLFYAHKIVQGTQIGFSESAGGTTHAIRDYYIPSNSTDPTEDSQTIHFGSEMSEYTRENSPKSLFETFYKSYIEEVYDDSRRIFKYKAYLPLSIISNIQLNDKVIVFNELYKINKMVTNFETGVTDFELVNEILDFEVEIDDVIADTVKTVDQSIATADNTIIKADSTVIRW